MIDRIRASEKLGHHRFTYQRNIDFYPHKHLLRLDSGNREAEPKAVLVHASPFMNCKDRY